eukprot:GFUD01005765.1.p1 GENE.GFUD01005765.1~~GFUD01005765.1.p1  ORF type:complete len:328 (-),score=66.88 GFUD01005765.1:130-1092(-)
MEISVIFIFTLTVLISYTSGHARLLEPPSRSSMWRMGYPTPPDYQDNEGFCGGYQVQWGVNGGKCGVCGDAYNDPVKEHEAPGGRFATGIIVREYQPGDTMDITVDVTANHQGYFTFRLCPVQTANTDPGQECFERPDHLLSVITTNSDHFLLPDKLTRKYQVTVQLPSHIECEHCILQWTYTCGNNWGRCPDGVGRVGCGPQETFRACADFSMKNGLQQLIQPEHASHDGTAVLAVPGYHHAPLVHVPVPQLSSQAIVPLPHPLPHPLPQPPHPLPQPLPLVSCTPVGPYTRLPGMAEWCDQNCGHDPPHCPPSHCHCV